MTVRLSLTHTKYMTHPHKVAFLWTSNAPPKPDARGLRLARFFQRFACNRMTSERQLQHLARRALQLETVFTATQGCQFGFFEARLWKFGFFLTQRKPDEIWLFPTFLTCLAFFKFQKIFQYIWVVGHLRQNRYCRSLRQAFPYPTRAEVVIVTGLLDVSSNAVTGRAPWRHLSSSPVILMKQARRKRLSSTHQGI